MSDARDHVDPWEDSIDDLARAARLIETHGDPKAHDLSTVEARRQFAAHILQVLQARVVLEAADRQRQAIETQTETTRSLVRVTWLLVGVTAILAIAAAVALLVA